MTCRHTRTWESATLILPSSKPLKPKAGKLHQFEKQLPVLLSIWHAESSTDNPGADCVRAASVLSDRQEDDTYVSPLVLQAVQASPLVVAG